MSASNGTVDAATKLSSATARSRSLSDDIDALFGGLTQCASTREVAAAALFQLALAHHKGIFTLLDQRLALSAAALLRPQWESFVRGSYMLSITDEEASNVLSEGKYFPNFPDLLAVIPDDEGRALLIEIHEENRTLANDFTHGGVELICRISNADSPSFKESELIAFLSNADSVAILSAGKIACLHGAEDLVRRIHEFAESFARHRPIAISGK